MKTVRCSFNNIHQNRKNLPRNKDDAYAHEVTERSAVPERSEVVWFSSNEVRGGADIFLDHSGSTYIIPKLSLYSTGLMPPKVILIRSSLYQ